MGVRATVPGDSFDWHRQSCDELCLVEGGTTTLGHAGKRLRARSSTLVLFRRGERHGFWNDRAGACPRLWVLHFDADDRVKRELKVLFSSSPARRVWSLTLDQRRTYEAFFQRIQIEQAQNALHAQDSLGAWLSLLLVTLRRWQAGEHSLREIGPAISRDAEVAVLWEAVQSRAKGSASETGFITTAGYDSLRHRFRREFGVSPRTMVGRLRMEKAKHLLLDTSLTIKEIAEVVGYARQHEFCRAFHRATGMAPTAWRRHFGQTK